ncbi:hypothetical protein CXR26_02175 [Brevibacterium aurantiacum]|nr:hypothetical protein CXR26_02175 [Brevibacterium aurantiacum]
MCENFHHRKTSTSIRAATRRVLESPIYTLNYEEPGKLVTIAIYAAIGPILGSVLGYIIRKLIYAVEYHDDYTKTPLIVTASVCTLLIITCGVLIGTFDRQGFAVVYGIGASVGAVSFFPPWWTMHR